MIISYKHKVIFFAAAKTGTNSIEQRLRKYDQGDELKKTIDRELAKIRRPDCALPLKTKHVRPLLVKHILGKKQWDEYFKFAFVRNPWDWLISAYHSNIKREEY